MLKNEFLLLQLVRVILVYIFPALKEIGTKVIPVVASVLLAKRLLRGGIDAIIAEGTESGGHVGDITTMALLPQVVDAVDVPVIAAGGIADGRGVAAAFALGAHAVQMGTRFVLSEECIAHENYKKRCIESKRSFYCYDWSYNRSSSSNYRESIST